MDSKSWKKSEEHAQHRQCVGAEANRSAALTHFLWCHTQLNLIDQEMKCRATHHNELTSNLQLFKDDEKENHP